MKRFTFQLGGLVALTVVPSLFVCVPFAPPNLQAQIRSGQLAGGAVTGTIVDAEGVPQMGAVVQLLLPDTSLAAMAMTDVHGHYHLAGVAPGAYRVRVSAALFLPSVRRHLLIANSTRAVVNMTLSTMLSSTDWLPATRRTAADADDDWMWTMRSSTMRPVLRLATDEDGVTVPASATSVSSSSEQPNGLITAGRVTVQDNEGGFARGGTHNVLSLVRRSGDSVSFVRADLSGPRTPFPVSPSADLTVGWERTLPFSGTSRTVLSYSSHPEVQGVSTRLSTGPAGLQSAVLRNAQRMNLGDGIRVDAGTVTRDMSLGGNIFVVEPFVRVAVRPSNGIVIAYSFSDARGNESIDDLDRVRPASPAVLVQNGHAQSERGSHHALSVSGKTPGRGVLELAVFHDRMVSPTITGIGDLQALDAGFVGSATDLTTASFLVAARNYRASGVRVAIQQPLTSSLSIEGSFVDGQALHATAGADAMLQQALAGLVSSTTLSASVGVNGIIQRSGTAIRTGYRWQPQDTLTAVDRFRTVDDTAYLHCQIRQSLRALPLLPANLEAVLEVQNLLEQGYTPFVSHDGQTLYLAQSPRILQAGLSFSF